MLPVSPNWVLTISGKQWPTGYSLFWVTTAIVKIATCLFAIFKCCTCSNHNILDTTPYLKEMDMHALLYKSNLLKITFERILKSQLIRFLMICNNVEDFRLFHSHFHIPSGRHLPAIRALQRDCHWGLKSNGNSNWSCEPIIQWGTRQSQTIFRTINHKVGIQAN